jgi:hypothetical protein
MEYRQTEVAHALNRPAGNLRIRKRRTLGFDIRIPNQQHLKRLQVEAVCKLIEFRNAESYHHVAVAED